MGKQKKKETALAKTHDEDAPKWLQPVKEEDVVEGLENMRPGDLLVPRLVLLQALSPQVNEGDNIAGQIINSITGEVWIDKDEKENFIPVYHYIEWIQWGDRDLKEGIIARSLDPNGKLAQMAMRAQKYTDSKGVEQFMVTEYHNIVTIFPEIDDKMPIIISCAKTNHKKGRKLLGLARYRGRYPLYAGQYSIQSNMEENQAGQKYYVFDFANAGWAAKELFEALKELYSQIKDAYDQRKLFADQQDREHEAAEHETEM